MQIPAGEPMSLEGQVRALERGRDQEFNDPDPEAGDGVVTPSRPKGPSGLREIARVWAAHHETFSDERGLVSAAILGLIDDRERLLASVEEIRGILNGSKTHQEKYEAILLAVENKT